MIVRIVRMTFAEDKVDAFLSTFDQYKEEIRNQPGCNHLTLLQDHHQKNIFSTYSHWDDEASLNSYRNSPTFGEVWPVTKKLFTEKPIAHSYEVNLILR